METIIKFLIRNHFVIFFIGLQFIAINLVIDNNDLKKERYLTTANAVAGYFHSIKDRYTSYFNLREENQRLAKEIVEIRNKSVNTYYYHQDMFRLNSVGNVSKQYEYFYAEVVRNSLSSQHNHITINAGSNQGISPGMGVVNSNGVVGIVREVSNNFCTAISLLNIKLGLSVKLKRNDYFGSLTWLGKVPLNGRLDGIPAHALVDIGDSVVTSGFSTIFPEGFMVGTVAEMEKIPGGSFYNITVSYSADFFKLNHVYIIRNNLSKEQLELESKTDSLNSVN